MNHLQDMIDGMNARMQKERTASQMTLGTLIERLESLPPDTLVDGIENPHSYRGYYCDLAFERAPNRITASAALALCKSAMGEVFEGYKGGDFQMGKSTPVWCASYGSTGEKITGVSDDGALALSPDET